MAQTQLTVKCPTELLYTCSKGNSGSSVKIAPKCVDLKEDSTAKLNCNPASAVDPCDLEETSEHTENAAVMMAYTDCCGLNRSGLHNVTIINI